MCCGCRFCGREHIVCGRRWRGDGGFGAEGVNRIRVTFEFGSLSGQNRSSFFLCASFFHGVCGSGFLNRFIVLSSGCQRGRCRLSLSALSGANRLGHFLLSMQRFRTFSGAGFCFAGSGRGVFRVTDHVGQRDNAGIVHLLENQLSGERKCVSIGGRIAVILKEPARPGAGQKGGCFCGLNCPCIVDVVFQFREIRPPAFFIAVQKTTLREGWVERRASLKHLFSDRQP